MPPRRTGGGTSLAIALIVGVIIFVGMVALFFVRSCRSVAQPPSQPMTPAGEPNAPPLFPELATPDEPPPPDGPPNSPQASAHVRPPWGKLERLTIHAQKTSQFAPQHSKPLDTFLAGAPLAGDLENAYVVCRAQSYGKNDTFAGDDLHFRATFGAVPEIANDGPEDANLGFVSAPHVTLKKGETVKFEVFDRDVTTMALITRAQVPYSGAGVSSNDVGAAIECRSLAGAPLGKLADTDARAADAAIAKLVHVKLDGSSPSWGWPYDGVKEALRTTGDVAALLGWDEPRARQRAEKVTSQLQVLDDQKKKVFAELYAGSKPELHVGSLTVSSLAMTCDDKVLIDRCGVTAHVKNDSDKGVRVSAIMGGTSFYVATEKTGPLSVSLEQDGQLLLEIPPKSDGAFTFKVSALAKPEDKVILGVCTAPSLTHGAACHAARVR